MQQNVAATHDTDEYGTDQVPHDKREYNFFHQFSTWFGSGVNTGSWYFGGMAAALGMVFVFQYSLIYLPLMMIPWAMLGWIAYKHGATTVVSSTAAFGVSGRRLIGWGEFFGMIGWPSVNTYIAAISLTYVFHAMFGWAAFGSPGSTWPLVAGIVATSVAQGVAVVIGQRAIKYLEMVSMVLLVALGIWESVVVLHHFDFNKVMAVRMPTHTHSVAFFIDLAFGFAWGWAMIGDFARLAKSGVGATLGSWLGINIGQGWFMIIGGLGVVGVMLQTGTYDPNNSDPSSIVASLGLGTIAFLVVFFATLSTNITVLYGSGIGLVGATKSKSPKKYLIFIAILQFFMCFLPLMFASFVDYFEFFLGILGGIFIPMWTLIFVDYFIVRKRELKDEDLFAGVNPDGSTKSRLGDWNTAGWISAILGLGVFYLLNYGLTSIAAVTTASFPAIAVTAGCYLVLTLMFGMGQQSRGKVLPIAAK